MAYDFLIGATHLIKDNPITFGSIDLEDVACLSRIAQNNKNWFFEGLQNLFDDRTYGDKELLEAAKLIDWAILKCENGDDLKMLYKLSAAVSMAIRLGMPLHGVAD